MGTSADGRRIARQAKIRLYQHSDGGPPLAIHWHWQGWSEDDGTIVDTGSGSYTGDADEMMTKLHGLLSEIEHHMVRGINPFGTTPWADGTAWSPQVEAEVAILKAKGWAES